MQARSNLLQVSTGSCLLGLCVRLPPWNEGQPQGQSLKVEPAQTNSEGDVNMLNVSQGGPHTRHTKLLLPESTGVILALRLLFLSSPRKSQVSFFFSRMVALTSHNNSPMEATDGFVFPAPDKEQPTG